MSEKAKPPLKRIPKEHGNAQEIPRATLRDYQGNTSEVLRVNARKIVADSGNTWNLKRLRNRRGYTKRIMRSPQPPMSNKMFIKHPCHS